MIHVFNALKLLLITILIPAFVLADTITVPIAMGSDDAQENSSNNVDIQYSGVQFNTESNGIKYNGFRFQNITIPNGATITNAYIQFTSDAAVNEFTITDNTIWGEDTDNALTYQALDFNLANRTKTTSSVAWHIAEAWAQDERGINQQSPDLTTIVQEIVNRSGWSSGNAMAFLLSTSQGYRAVKRYETSATYAAELHIEYTASGGGAPAISIADTNCNEGDSGTTNCSFNVSLSTTYTQSVTVDYTTSNGTATSGSDYTASSGTLTIPSGSSTGTITIPIIGDTTSESNETLTLSLSNPTNATITDATGIGTIIDDDISSSSSITVQISSDSDDAIEQDGTAKPLSWWLQFESSFPDGFKFNNITIPQGATITNAYIQFSAGANGGDSGTINTTIYGEDTDNAATFSEVANGISGRTKTSANTAWNISTVWNNGDRGVNQQTPDLKNIVQEIVNRAGWTSGNAMAFVVTSSSTGSYRQVVAHESNNAQAAELHIEYTTTTTVSPIVEYRMDECLWFGSGSVQDSIGAYHATPMNGAAPTSDGQINNSGQLNGTKYITLATKPTLGTEWSMAFWLKFPLDSTDHTVLRVNGTDQYAYVVGSVEGDGDLAYFEHDSGSTNMRWGVYNNTQQDASNDFPDNLTGWHHIALVKNGSTTTLYLDNTSLNSIALGTSGNVAVVGTSTDDPGGQTIGSQMDEVKFYDTALTTTQISSLYTNENSNKNYDGTTRTAVTCTPPPTLSIQDKNCTEGDGGTTDCTFTISLSGSYTDAITLDYATSANTAATPSDYTTTSGSLTIAAGNTSATFNVPVIGDADFELDETFTVTLSSISTAQSDLTATGTIINDDVAVATLVSEYRFDECSWNGTANEVTDNGGNNYHGTSLNGAYVQSGRLNNGGYFDGTDDYLQQSNIYDTLKTTSSLSFWIKTAQTGSNIPYNAPGITGVEQSGGQDDIFWGWIDASGHIGLVKGDSGSALSITSINNNFWHHIVLTRNAVNGENKVYVDGVLEHTATSGTGDVGNPFDRIGSIGDTGGTPTYFQGQLDELKVYSGILTLSEVQTIYTNENANNNYDGSTRTAVSCTPPPTLSIQNENCTEGDSGATNCTFTVVLSASYTADINLDYVTSANTATANSDYTTTSGSLTISAGSTSGTFNIPVIGDTAVESDETFTITLSNITTGQSNLTATGTIMNDDIITIPAPIAEYRMDECQWINPGDVKENNGDYNGTARNGAAPSLIEQRINNSANFTGDNYVELQNQPSVGSIYTISMWLKFPLSTANHTNYGSSGHPRYYLNMADRPGSSSDFIYFFKADSTWYWVVDDDVNGNKSSTIVLPTSGWHMVTFVVENSTTKLYIDTEDKGTLAGSAQGSLSILGTSDYNNDYAGQTIGTYLDEFKIFNSVFSFDQVSAMYTYELNGKNYDGTDRNAQISIADVNMTEGNTSSTNMTFTVSLSKPAICNGVTVDYTIADGTATAGSDYTTSSGTVTISGGSSSATITVPIIGDTLYEPDETFTVTLSNPTNATISDNTAIGTIINDEIPTLSISDQNCTEGDSGTTGCTFMAQLSNAHDETISVVYTTSDGTATAGSDYTASTATLTIPAGSTSTTFTIPVIGDIIVEDNETIIVTFSNPINAAMTDMTAVGTILDDETLTISIDDQNCTEGDSGTANCTFTVLLSNPYANDLSIDYMASDNSATAGVDYTASSGTLTIVSGDTNTTFTVPVIGDTSVEGDESFTITLSNISSGHSDVTAIGTILDDDVPTPLADYRFDECAWKTATADVNDSSGNNYNGTAVNGALVQSAKINNGGLFDGIDDYIDLPDISADFSGGVTISAWVKFDSGATWERIIELATGTSLENSINLTRYNGENRLQFQLRDATGTDANKTELITGIIPEMSDGNLHHYVVTLSDDKIARLYVDGTQIVSQTLSYMPTIATRTLNYIGKAASDDNYFKGIMDEVKIFDTGLLPAQVAKLYSYESTGTNYDGSARVAGSCTFCQTVVDIPEIECEALTVIYNNTDGGNWTDNSGWLSDITANNWHGISVTNGHVDRLELNNNNLTGEIPSEISNLSQLYYVWISDNALTGSIPTSINLLTKLQNFYVQNNALGGQIPDFNSTAIKLIRFDGNQFTGSFTDSLCLSNALKSVMFNDNNLSGTIPSCYAAKPNLTTFQFRDNRYVFADFESEHTTYLSKCGANYKNNPQAKVDSNRTITYLYDENITITPEYSENPSGNDTYQWYKDGLSIDGATGRVLTITNATAYDEGIYTYTVNNTVVTDLSLDSNEINVIMAIPVADYRLDSCSWNGTTGEVIDSSGNELNATALNGTTPVGPGIINNSALFNGTDQYISGDDILNDVFGNTNDRFTITAWIKPTALETNATNHFTQNTFLAKAHDSHNDNLEIGINTDGSLHLYIDTKNQDRQTNIGSGITVDSWHFIAISYDGNEVKVKIDNSEFTDATTWANGGNLDQASGSPLTIGASLHIDNFFTGEIDELKIFDQALSFENLSTLYQRELLGTNYDSTHRMKIDCTVPELIAEYRFDECSYDGSVGEVIDNAGSDNSGTVTGTVDTEISIDKTQKVIGNAVALNGGAIDIAGLNISTANFKKNTVMFWMYWNGEQYLMPFGWNYYDLYFTDGGFGFNTSNSDLYGISSSGLSTGWHHVAAVFTNGDVNSNRLYIDGQLQLLAKILANSPLDTCAASMNARIGGWPTDTGHRFKSYMDELKIYKGELDGTTIQNIFNNEVGGYNYDGTTRNAVICSQALFNAVDQSGGCFDWNNNIQTKIAGDTIALTVLSADGNDNNNSLTDANITKLELLSFSDAACSTHYATTEIWSGNQAVDTSGCFIPTGLTYNKAVKCAKVKIIGLFEGIQIESNSTDTFSIRPDSFALQNIPSGKLIAEHSYPFSVQARNIDGVTLSADYNTSITPTSQKWLRDGNDGTAVMEGNFTLSTGALDFQDGETASTGMAFNNVGLVSMELNDTTWTEVDTDDTPLSNRTIYVNQNMTFIPDHFSVAGSGALVMVDYASNFTYLSNDLTMSASLRDLNFTITAQGENNGTMTNYQNPKTEFYANNIDLDPSVGIDPTPQASPIPGSMLNQDIVFGAGIASVSYPDIAFNYDRNRSNPINPFTVNGADGNFSLIVTDTVDATVTGGVIETLTGNATFYYGRVNTTSIKTQDAATEGQTSIEVYASSPLENFTQSSSNWYVNGFEDSITAIQTGDFSPRQTINLNSSASNLTTESVSSYIDGKSIVAVSTAETNAFKSYIHMNIPTWLWYSKYKDYDFSATSDCSEHPCIEYIYQLDNATTTGIRSGDFNGTRFDNQFTPNTTQKALKLLR